MVNPFFCAHPSESRLNRGLTRKRLGGCSEVEDLAKADGLELHYPQGALAIGQCGLGNDVANRSGLEEGHSHHAIPILATVHFFRIFAV